MTHVGFTGTRKGMTHPQNRGVLRVLICLDGDIFHHGDCLGSDAESDGLAREAGYRIHIHPPTDNRLQAFCAMPHVGDIVSEPLTYLKRNHAIGDACDVLVAAPGSMVEYLHSGTWSTVRYARKIGRRVIVVLPDGSVG